MSGTELAVYWTELREGDLVLVGRRTIRLDRVATVDDDGDLILHGMLSDGYAEREIRLSGPWNPTLVVVERGFP